MSRTTLTLAAALSLVLSGSAAQGDIFGQVLRSQNGANGGLVRLPVEQMPEQATWETPSLAEGPISQVGLAAASGSAGDGDGCCGAENCDACVSCAGNCSSRCGKCCGCGPRLITFGEVLYLHPTDVDFTYAIPRNGVAPAGPVGTADPDFELGFRTGIGWSPDGQQSIMGSFTWFESDTVDQVSVAPGGNVGSQVIHPATASAASVFLRATATYDIDFQLADISYRAIVGRSPRAQIAYSGGLRYARLEENASVLHDLTAFTPTTVTTDMDFEGLGIRLGVDGRRDFPLGLLFYGRGAASFIAGEYDGTYNQVNALNVVEAASDIEDDRIVTILEAELGVGWVSPCERVRLTAGYYFAGWYNAMPTNSYIRAVQANNFVDISDTITFSGLVSRAEIQF